MNIIERLQKLSGIPVTESVKEPVAAVEEVVEPVVEAEEVEAVAAEEVVAEETTVVEETAEEVVEPVVEKDGDTLWVLKVCEPDSEKYGIQFSGTRQECAEEWNDIKKDWPKGSKHKIERHVEESTTEVAARIMELGIIPASPIAAITPQVDYQNGPVENYGNKRLRATETRLPSAVRKAVTTRIAELERAIAAYDDKGYDDKSIKQQAVDCLKQILDNLSTNDMEGVQKAQIYINTLMSPLTDFFPPQIINWLANAQNPLVKEGYNRDFQPNDDIGNKRLESVINKLKELVQFATPTDPRANQLIAVWVQSNVGQAFWGDVADWLLDNDFDSAASDVREFYHESGY